MKHLYICFRCRRLKVRGCSLWRIPSICKGRRSGYLWRIL